MNSIIIPLGKGSRWNDTELRYCLRSVEKHLKGYGEIFIIGERPYWLQNVIHIPAEDGDKAYEKERNIFNKIMIACNDERVTEEFLFMNDDHFLLQDFDAGKFPIYADGSLSDMMNRADPYQQTVFNTICQKADGPYYDVHCPINFHKEWVSKLKALDWNLKWGYCIKTLYCSDYYSNMDFIEIPDLKIRDAIPSSKIKELIADRPWFSMDNRAREGGMLAVLQELYPTKSKYEK